jgi:hypothetical protein
MLDTQVFCKNPYNLSVSNAEGGSPLNYLRFEALKETVDRFFGSSVIPYKKVYLSRSRSGVRNFKYINQDSGEIESISDERIINEELLEEYLSSIGFEIINLEDKFDDYIEQMSFFRKVKVLLTPTSTGAMNILHMLPKTTLIEFSVPMVVGKFNQEFSEGIISITHHSAYPQLAFHSKANYIQISAGNSAEEIVKYLKNSNFLKLIVE